MSTPAMPARTSLSAPADDEIVQFFDAELVSGAALDRLVRDAAAFADCSVGVESADGRTEAEAHPADHDHAHDPAQDPEHDQGHDLGTAERVTRPLPGGGLVWTRGLASSVADLFLTRLAVAVAVAQLRAPAHAAVAHPLDVLIGRQSSGPERA